MKRFHVVAVALVAVFAVSMAAVSAASAVEFLLALWLANGESVTSALLVETEGELELVSLNAGGLGITTKLLCSGILDGWVGPESLDFVSELLTLTGTLIPTSPLTGTPLLCANSGNCTEPEVWADVPFETEVELMIDAGTTFFVDLLLNAGWYAQCLILGVTAAELCESPAEGVAAISTNEANGTVGGELSDAIQELSGGMLGTCTLGGAKSAEVNSVGKGVTLEPGVTLSISSE
jgi:hypothetical protein